MSALRFGPPGEFKRSKDHKMRRQTVIRLGTAVTRASVTRGYLENLEAGRKAREVSELDFASLLNGKLPASVRAEYTEHRIASLLAAAHQNAIAMEFEQETECYS